MEYNLIDVLVTTGANIIHDLVDGVNDIGHYLGSSDVDDDELFRFRINRIYDVFLPEENYKHAENRLLGILKKIFNKKKVHITPNELIKKVGKRLITDVLYRLQQKIIYLFSYQLFPILNLH